MSSRQLHQSQEQDLKSILLATQPFHPQIYTQRNVYIYSPKDVLEQLTEKYIFFSFELTSTESTSLSECQFFLSRTQVTHIVSLLFETLGLLKYKE